MATTVVLLMGLTAVLAPEASAQRGRLAEAGGEPLLAWYDVESGGRTQTVQARVVTVHTRRGRTTLLVDGREVASRGEVTVTFRGTGDRPDRPRSEDDGSTTTVRTFIRVYEDGTVETGSWITKTDSDGKTISDTKTTTTTTTDDEGNTTSTTTTEDTSTEGGSSGSDSGGSDGSR